MRAWIIEWNERLDECNIDLFVSGNAHEWTRKWQHAQAERRVCSYVACNCIADASIKHTSQSIRIERSNYYYRQHFSSLIKIIQYQRIRRLSAAQCSVFFSSFCSVFFFFFVLMHFISFIHYFFFLLSFNSIPFLLHFPHSHLFALSFSFHCYPLNMLMCAHTNTLYCALQR